MNMNGQGRQQATPTFLLILLLAVPGFADFSRDARGTTTANFLKLGVGARAVAMGEAFSAVADDSTALYWNPAGLVRVENQDASFMHAPYLDSTFYDYGAYARRRNNHAWGAGIQFFSAGSIPQTDENNASLGSFSPHDLAASLGYAYRFSESGLALGIAGKFIQSKIVESASTLAVDAGLQTRPYWDRLRLGVTVSNLGGKMKFEQDSESLPLIIRYGSAFQISDRWLASADIVTPKDNGPAIALGTEYLWKPAARLDLAGRLGYNSRTAGDVSGFTGVSLGFGLGWERFNFDYAFLPYGSLGMTHRMSIAFKWGQPDDEALTLSLGSRRKKNNHDFSDHDFEQSLP